MIDGKDQPLSSNLCLVLLDNGSLKAESTIRLRSLAVKLSACLGVEVYPVSVRHSDKVDPSELEGVPADVWSSFLERMLNEGKRLFKVIPLFFGQSGALVDYVPALFEKKSRGFPEAAIECAKTLVDLGDPEDCGLAEIVSALILEKLETINSSRISKIFLIDHGSPLARVAGCRDLVATQVSKILSVQGVEVLPCSMERRDGEAYSFSDPLLSALLDGTVLAGETDVLLSRMFLFPGRHACPGGDIDMIIAGSSWVRGGGKVHQTDLLGESLELVALLERRYKAMVGGRR